MSVMRTGADDEDSFQAGHGSWQLRLLPLQPRQRQAQQTLIDPGAHTPCSSMSLMPTAMVLSPWPNSRRTESPGSMSLTPIQMEASARRKSPVSWVSAAQGHGGIGTAFLKTV